MTLPHYRPAGKPYAFYLRYLRAKPFIWKGATYFVLREAGGRGVEAVVKLDPAHRIQDMCVFKFKESCVRGPYETDTCIIRLK